MCTRAVMQLGWSSYTGEDDGFWEVRHTDRNCMTISALASGDGNEGELPFTGPGQGILLEGAVGLVLLGTGAALVRRLGRRVHR